MLQRDILVVLSQVSIKLDSLGEMVEALGTLQEKRFSTILMVIDSMDQRIADAIGRVQSALTAAIQKEVNDIKALLPADIVPEVVTALDNLATNITNSIEQISDDVSSTEPPPEGETPVP